MAFLYSRGPNLTCGNRIASLISYDGKDVSAALERLEDEKLIERLATHQHTMRSTVGVEVVDTLLGGFDGCTTMVVGVLGAGKTRIEYPDSLGER